MATAGKKSGSKKRCKDKTCYVFVPEHGPVKVQRGSSKRTGKGIPKAYALSEDGAYRPVDPLALGEDATVIISRTGPPSPAQANLLNGGEVPEGELVDVSGFMVGVKKERYSTRDGMRTATRDALRRGDSDMLDVLSRGQAGIDQIVWTISNARYPQDFLGVWQSVLDPESPVRRLAQERPELRAALAFLPDPASCGIVTSKDVVQVVSRSESVESFERVRAWTLDPLTGEVVPLSGKFRSRVESLEEGSRVVLCEGVPRVQWFQGGDVPRDVTRVVVSDKEALDFRRELLGNLDEDVKAAVLPESRADYYQGVVGNHFSANASGSRFVNAEGRQGLEDVVQAAIVARGSLDGDDADEMGIPADARMPGVRYLKVPVPGVLGVVDKHKIPEEQRKKMKVEAQVLKTIPASGEPGDVDYQPERQVTGLTIESKALRQPATAYATLILGPPPGGSPGDSDIVYTAHPGAALPAGPSDLASVAGMEPGETKTVADLMDVPEVRFLRVSPSVTKFRTMTEVDVQGGSSLSVVGGRLRAMVTRTPRPGSGGNDGAKHTAQAARTVSGVLAEALGQGFGEFLTENTGNFYDKDVYVIAGASGLRLPAGEVAEEGSPRHDWIDHDGTAMFGQPTVLDHPRVVMDLKKSLERTLKWWEMTVPDERVHVLGDLLHKLRACNPYPNNRERAEKATRRSRDLGDSRKGSKPNASSGVGKTSRRAHQRAAATK